MAKERISNNSVATDAPIVLFANSPEVTSINKAFIRTIPGADLGQFIAGVDVGGSSEIDLEVLAVTDSTSESDKSAASSDPNLGQSDITKLAPLLSDMSVISQEVKYDSAGNPTVTVTVRVKNSLNLPIKGLAAKVQVL